jgi:hypothetical protein
MAYTGLLKILGALVRWMLNGFRIPFSEYCDEDFDRPNFIAGLVVVLILVLVLVPLVCHLVL